MSSTILWKSSEESVDTSILLLVRMECRFGLGRCLIEWVSSMCENYSNEEKMSTILCVGYGKDVTDRANDKQTLCCNLSIYFWDLKRTFLCSCGNPKGTCLRALQNKYLSHWCVSAKCYFEFCNLVATQYIYSMHE